MSWNRTRCDYCLGKGKTFKVKNAYDAIYHRLVCNENLKKKIVFDFSDPILDGLVFNIDQVLDLIDTIKSISHIIIHDKCEHNMICKICCGLGYTEG